MLRSMFSSVSGLRTHQSMMDVVGNNIANVNTVGYKGSTAVFQDLLSQVVRGSGAPQAGNAGTNAAQVGMGVRLGSITTSFGQGASQLTGRSTDLAIQGDGFFITQLGGQTLYTRAGSFSFDTDGRLATPEGGVVQGWMANNGVVDSNGPIGPMILPMGQLVPPRPTASVTVGGNLMATTPTGSPLTTSIKVFDAIGTEHTLGLQLSRTGAVTWGVTTTVDGAAVAAAPATLTFTNGTLPPGSALNLTAPWGPIQVQLGGGAEGLTQFGSASSLAATGQDGMSAGSLQSFSISQSGELNGVFSNGLTQTLGQVALANFNNPAGLEKAGGNMYRPTVNSGLAQIGTAGSGGRGTLSGGTLEMSNVDLAQEFTNLIVAQRGFQANSRVITSSDEILQDLVNLKR